MIADFAKCAAATVVFHAAFLGLSLLAGLAPEDERAGLAAGVFFLERVADIFVPLGCMAFLFVRKIGERVFAAEIFVSLALALLGTGLGYFVWGFCSGRLLSPDFGTVMVFSFVAGANVLSVLGLGVLLQVVLLFRNPKKMEES